MKEKNIQESNKRRVKELLSTEEIIKRAGISKSAVSAFQFVHKNPDFSTKKLNKEFK